MTCKAMFDHERARQAIGELLERHPPFEEVALLLTAPKVPLLCDDQGAPRRDLGTMRLTQHAESSLSDASFGVELGTFQIARYASRQKMAPLPFQIERAEVKRQAALKSVRSMVDDIETPHSEVSQSVGMILITSDRARALRTHLENRVASELGFPDKTLPSGFTRLSAHGHVFGRVAYALVSWLRQPKAED